MDTNHECSHKINLLSWEHKAEPGKKLHSYCSSLTPTLFTQAPDPSAFFFLSLYNQDAIIERLLSPTKHFDNPILL